MTGPGRVPPAAMPGETAQSSEGAAQPPLTWQRELDGALGDLDSRLSHPRRRATDMQPTLPQLGQPEITSEVIDEIAWRVARLLRDNGAMAPKGETVAEAISHSINVPLADPLPPPPYEPEPEQLPRGIAVAIRLRKPLFRWPFRRRRRRQPSMISLSDFGAT